MAAVTRVLLNHVPADVPGADRASGNSAVDHSIECVGSGDLTGLLAGREKVLHHARGWRRVAVVDLVIWRSDVERLEVAPVETRLEPVALGSGQMTQRSKSESSDGVTDR